jgi:hypothetical protein
MRGTIASDADDVVSPVNDAPADEFEDVPPRSPDATATGQPAKAARTTARAKIAILVLHQAERENEGRWTKCQNKRAPQTGAPLSTIDPFTSELFRKKGKVYRHSLL